MKTKFTLNITLLLIILFSAPALKVKAQWTLMDSTFQQSIYDFDFFDDSNGILTRGYVVNTTSNGANSWGPDVISSSNMRTVKYYGNSSTIFRGQDNGTIWKSINGGANWTQVGGYILSDMTALTFNGSNGIVVDNYCQIAWSNDGGATWTAIPSSALCGNISTLNQVDMPTPTIAYAGGANGHFFKSTNGGQNWTAITTLPADFDDMLGISFADTQTGFVSGTLHSSSNDTLLKTTDGGVTWTGVSAGLGTSISDVFAVNGNLIFAGAADKIYKSTNGGTTWSIDFTHPDAFVGNVRDFDIGGSTLFASYSGGGTHRKIVKLANVVSGIDEMQTQNTLFIFPNPTANQLIIDNTQLTIESIDIYNLVGENILHRTLHKKNKTILDVHSLPTGIYFVAVRDERNNLVVRKIVKM